MKKIYLLILLSLTFIFSCNQDRFISSVKVPVNEGTSGGTSGGTGGTTGGAIEFSDTNTLTNVVVPATATINGTLNISFDYTTTAYRRIYVAVKSADWGTEYVSADIRDIGGAGNKAISLDLSGIAAGTYNIAIEMVENEDNYTSLSPQVGSWGTLTIQ